MLKNYLQLAVRHLSKHRLYAGINIFGLALGIGACLLLYRIVNYESGFNQDFTHADRMMRIITHEHDPSGNVGKTAGIPLPAIDQMKEIVPQFEHFARVCETWPTVVVPQTGGLPPKKFALKEGEIAFFADPSFLLVFDWKLLAGDPTTALDAVNKVILTKTWAEKCFGDWKTAIGKQIIMDSSIPLSVTGVMEDAPSNCDFPMTMLIAYPTLKANANLYNYSYDWGSTSSNNQAFALLRNADQTEAANASLEKVGEQEYSKQGDGKRSRFHYLQSLSDLHFNQEIGNSGTHSISRSRLYVLTCIGILIMLMACFNFVNLATAQATIRAREVGVRKALGGSKPELIRQFMTETGLIVFMATVLGSGLAFAGIPLLKHISDVPAEWPLFGLPMTWTVLGVLFVAITLLSGLYPAMILGGFNPIKALKKDTADKLVGGVSVRKILVVLQFMIAQGLIICTLIALDQLTFIRNMDMGFKQDMVYGFNFQNDSITRPKLATLKQRIQQVPGVVSVSLNSDDPASNNTWSSNFSVGGKEDAPFNTSMKICDADYINTYGLQLVNGRWLSQSDTLREVVVNETLARKLGMTPDEILGKPYRMGGRKMVEIVGVVKDFNTHSIREPLEPITILSQLRFFNQAAIKLQAAQAKTAIASIEKIYDETFPDQVFEGKFYDESIQKFYTSETRFAATCRGFAGIAIFIACLGLLGLAAHMAARRTKEIGVRKVLGASVASLTNLLAKDFLKLVFIAFVIACPLAWFAMNVWLKDFAFRINISWVTFVIAGIAAMLIAYGTVSIQSLKASLVNPVKSLKSE